MENKISPTGKMIFRCSLFLLLSVTLSFAPHIMPLEPMIAALAYCWIFDPINMAAVEEIAEVIHKRKQRKISNK